MRIAGRGHVPGRGECRSDGIIQFGAGKASAADQIAAGDQDFSIGKEGSCVWCARAAVMFPTGVRVPAEGSYTAAPPKGYMNPSSSPPATNTLPSVSKVAVNASIQRGKRGSVSLNVPLRGS